jgi:hypothetical protein
MDYFDINLNHSIVINDQSFPSYTTIKNNINKNLNNIISINFICTYLIIVDKLGERKQLLLAIHK